EPGLSRLRTDRLLVVGNIGPLAPSQGRRESRGEAEPRAPSQHVARPILRIELHIRSDLHEFTLPTDGRCVSPSYSIGTALGSPTRPEWADSRTFARCE